MAMTVWRRRPSTWSTALPKWSRASPATTRISRIPSPRTPNQPKYAKNALRSRKPEFLVLIGTCTHLGCLPKQRFDDG